MKNKSTHLSRLKPGSVQWQIELREVSEDPLVFDGASAAERFLGVANAVIASYVSQRVKIIKSKINGKTYTIKKKSAN